MIEKAPLKPYLLNEYDPERLDVGRSSVREASFHLKWEKI